jgi:hypothetical protein
MTKKYHYRPHKYKQYKMGKNQGINPWAVAGGIVLGVTAFAIYKGNDERFMNSLKHGLRETSKLISPSHGRERHLDEICQELQPQPTPSFVQAEPSFKTNYDSLVERIRNDAGSIEPPDYKNYLESSLEKVLDQWYGTRWSMNGATRQPRKGSVGCDYLVIRALEGLGYNFDLDKLGFDTITDRQTTWLASENIVKASSTQVKELWNTSYKNLKRYINTQGDGIYVIGTDTHVGFLQKKGDELYFMHSSQRPHGKVVKEKAEKVSTLRDSNVYVIGKLFTPDTYDSFFQKKYKPIPVSGQ